MTAFFKVLHPGLHATIQDLGRTGHQRFGIPVSGALDAVALRAANVVVGNRQTTAGLEMAVMGPTLEVEAGSVRVAVAGGGATLIAEAVDGSRREVPSLESVTVAKGGRIRFGPLTGGAVAYLAVEGGFALPAFLGSLSTYARGGFGGLGGRALAPGDLVPLGIDEAPAREEVRLPGFELAPPSAFRVVLGPQDDYFAAEAISAFLGTPYRVTRDADRMGLRLEGTPLDHAKGYNIVSDGIAPGSIQVPGSRQPILLLADRQTTGGYPKIATVISADLAGAGRLQPGMAVRFSAVTMEEARNARRQLEAEMAALPTRLVGARQERLDLDRLHEANLVSGVVDAHGHHD